MDGRIFHLKEKLLSNLKHQWTIEEMAEIVEVSVPHLQRLFKSEAGMPPIAWLKDKRLETASRLLKTKFCRIQQIGIEIGMPNDSHLTRDFKKKYGLTPSEYRRQFWENIQAENQDG